MQKQSGVNGLEISTNDHYRSLISLCSPNVDDFIVPYLLGELDCQSKLFFSSVAAFHYATERGRCTKRKRKKGMFCEDRRPEKEQNREECEELGWWG